jgi:hypothetical protein
MCRYLVLVLVHVTVLKANAVMWVTNKKQKIPSQFLEINKNHIQNADVGPALKV